MSDKKGFSSIADILSTYTKEEDKYISREFQQYGYDLAVELDDIKHKSLYIKMAKDTPRGQLEAARSYVKDAYEVESKGKLFMWRLKQIKDRKTEILKNKKT